ncbi:hypothetical protein WG66_014674 [Moniliophthora roreri]|nr:hypothetical protein WG66_014674 [Moniliophthora roreri]
MRCSISQAYPKLFPCSFLSSQPPPSPPLFFPITTTSPFPCHIANFPAPTARRYRDLHIKMDQFGLLPVGSALVCSRQFSRNQNVLMKYSRFHQNSSEGTPIRLTRRYTDIITPWFQKPYNRCTVQDPK